MCKESNIIRCGSHTIVKSISHVNEAVVNFNVSVFDVDMDISHGKFVSGKSGHSHHVNFLQ